MKTYHSKAQAILFEKVKALGDGNTNQGWRCVYFNLSGRDESHNSMLHRHFVVGAVTDLLAGIDGHIYVCDDGDIFILFHGALKPVIDKLATHFDGIMPERLDEQPEDPRFAIFDLNKHWRLFFQLCGAKLLQSRLAPGETPAHIAHYGRTVKSLVMFQD